MTSLEQINRYLRDLQTRMRVLAATRGVAISAATALVATVLLVWIGNRFQFAGSVVLPVRILLFAAVGAALFLALFIPLRRIDKRWTTRLAERRVDGLEQRLLTVSQADSSQSFTELLAEETLGIIHSQPAQDFGFAKWLPVFAACAVVSIGVLTWVIAAGPGYWGYGASLLWMGKGMAGARPLYEIAVQPGNKTVRRRSDQLITAELLNFSAPQVLLYAKYHGSTQWQQTPMQPQADGNGYQFSFVGLPNAVEYYVQAGASHSKHYSLGVRDLPAVKQVRTVIHFPGALGLRDVSNDNSGDVRAVIGSTAEVWIFTDRPLQHGELVLNDRSQIALTPQSGNWSKAILPVKKDGSYHVAVLDGDENIRISDDYFIEAKKDEPPSIKIVSPGRDPHVSPIEEVPVTVEASDDYGLKTLDLHYSVNGGPEKTVPLSKKQDVHQVQGKSTLYFENFKLVPGDLVSFYATARDANSTARTDIVFAQAEPFDYHFSQSQQAGGGGMKGGGDDDRISERQKDIIAATWNQLKNGPGEKSAVAENAHFLSQLEGKLGEQAQTLSERMGSRELAAESPEFKGFSDAMTQASQEMQRSVGVLKNAKWQDALAPEQRALQSLLRAEAMFHNIQVAYGAQGSQGMGGGGAERDLSRMLDLEMDKNKNQYETGNSASSSAGEQQKQKGLDEALQRLKMLAERQQQLAAQRQPDQLSQQRWEEEQLRREAEQLRQQLQQLSQSGNSASSQASSQQAGQQSASSSAQGQNSTQGQSSTSDTVRQAKDALQRAEDEMRKAVSSQDPSAQRRAAEQLAETAALLNNRAHAQAGSSVAEMAQRGQQIAQEQREINQQARRMYGGPNMRDSLSGDTDTADGSMPEMRDPRYGYRSWYWRQLQMQPQRSATPQERSLANSKEKLSRELEALQQQMQEQAQMLQDGQPGVSSKLRKALSDAEGEELALRMKKGAEWMRDGFGSRTYGMESSVTKGLEQLSQDLRAAQAAAAQSEGKGSAEDQKTLEALMQVRKLRQQLNARAQASQNSSQTGSTKSGSAQPGNSQQANAQSANNNGGFNGSAIPHSSIQEAENALSGLRQGLPAGDRDLSRQLSGAVGSLRHLDDSRAGEMEARLLQDLLPNLERLEAELSRRLEGTTGAPRMNQNETTPEQYRDAVAKYFRTLSQ